VDVTLDQKSKNNLSSNILNFKQEFRKFYIAQKDAKIANTIKKKNIHHEKKVLPLFKLANVDLLLS